MNRNKRIAAFIIAASVLILNAMIQTKAIGIADFRFATSASVLNNKDGSLLAAADSTSPAVISKEQAAQGIVIKDTISYMGLMSENEGYYLVTASLNRIGFDGSTSEVHREGPVRMTAPDMKEHEWIMTMTLNDLEEGTYAVFEQAEFHFNGTDEGNTELNLSHADAADTKQVIQVTSDRRVGSVIHANNYTAAADQPIVLTPDEAKKGVIIYDEVRVSGIDIASITGIHAQLVCLNDHSAAASIEIEADPFDWYQNDGWDIYQIHFLGTGIVLKPGRIYAAVFQLYNGNTLIASHEDLNDPMERIVTDAEIVSVEFHKQETGGSEELFGAGMKLVQGSDGNGAVLQEWISESTPKVFILEPGIYTLIETSAPSGYLLSDPIVFRITDELNAEVKISGEWIRQDSLAIIMKDQKMPKTPTPETSPSPAPKPEKPVNYVVPSTGVKGR